MNPTFSEKCFAWLHKYLVYVAVVLTVVYFAYQMRPQTSAAGDFNYRDFGKIPVIGEGRYKPIDTVARSALMVITHRQTYYDVDAATTLFGIQITGKRYPATKWLLDVLTTPPFTEDDQLDALFQNGLEKHPAWHQKVFRIESDQLKQFLKLEQRDGHRYSFVEILKDAKQAQALDAEVKRVRQMDPKKHNLFDGKVHELSEHLFLFLRFCSHAAPLVVPTDAGDDKWITFREALDRYGDNPPAGADAEAYEAYRKILVAYDQNDKAAFNSALDIYLKHLQAQGKLTKINTEVFFNEFQPFYHCLLVYLACGILAGLSWLIPSWAQQLRMSAFAMMAVALVVHFSGLILRMYLQDRWGVFVTNLYSSAVFIGLGCIIVSMIAEWFYGNGIAIVVGSVTGFSTLLIAHMLGLDGDTMVMMQAVLDTNFWLATHVTCVTLGYTMAFVAGFMGVAYILLGFFTDKLRNGNASDLARATYGVLCAGMFLSFVGTVLGGLWADYSWGRFWGWDPKENGALLIVIWISLILHARWGGMVKQRGLAVLSVLGIIITAWSWFGTNFLGVGLHAYGGAKGAQMLAMVLIDFGFLAIAGLGCLPLEIWQSFRPPVAPISADPPVQPKARMA